MNDRAVVAIQGGPRGKPTSNVDGRGQRQEQTTARSLHSSDSRASAKTGDEKSGSALDGRKERVYKEQRKLQAEDDWVVLLCRD